MTSSRYCQPGAANLLYRLLWALALALIVPASALHAQGSFQRDDRGDPRDSREFRDPRDTGATGGYSAGSRDPQLDGPVRLRQPITPGSRSDPQRSEIGRQPTDDPRLLDERSRRVFNDPQFDYRPGEFERFVQRIAEPVDIRRFGSELVTRTSDENVTDSNPLVPPDYLIKPGDEIVVTLWGSVDADFRVTVDRTGRITIPRVGPVLVSGVRYADLTDTISRRVAQVFRNFQLSVSLGQLRGVRVYVTGFVVKPGAYSVSSLSTIVHALMRAGGPSSAGSFRSIELRRGAQVVSTFDLYDFLLNGNRAADRIVQADDVIHVRAVGPQVGLIGSVNQPAVFELKPNDTVADVLRMAGGFTAVADRSRLAVERLNDRSTVRVAQLELPASNAFVLTNGDVVRAFSAVDAVIPVQQQNKRVLVEGEVLRPGEYVLPAASSIADALTAAGGLTPAAYVFGTEFNRESVRITQQRNYERALRDLETDFARASAGRRTASADEAAAASASAAATSQLIQRLRAVRPEGRIVLQVPPDAQALPDLALEDGDRLYIPPRPTAVGVFGSVFNVGSYLYTDGRNADEYLRLAGGPTRGADIGSIFVIRANGSVVAGRQRSSWFSSNSGFENLRAEAGDSIFVPEEINKSTFIQNAKDWTQIFSQFGLGLAAIQVLGR